ncbi:FMN-binding protein [Flavobacterium sp.]|jgi:Na+-translocating ferredoxin:NAD+ oxidoreductase RnfG subunit|uniref:FMN-binding protein n=1 Tax=Flavobacterium sp. TaxID=239 RepID=UPI002A83D685|nr:FMN-binding protein [Flavobacterium sp.]
MKINSLFTITLFVLTLFLCSFEIPKNLQKKVAKEIKATYAIENYTLTNVSVNSTLNNTLPIKVNNDNFYKVMASNKVLGYVFLDKAPSKTAEFDYLVLLDATGTIKKSNVLIYREEYGGEIGSTRWLRQFIGKSTNDNLEYKNNIDAISGATISVRSMINATNDVLKTVKILKENKVI